MVGRPDEGNNSRYYWKRRAMRAEQQLARLREAARSWSARLRDASFEDIDDVAARVLTVRASIDAALAKEVPNDGA